MRRLALAVLFLAILVQPRWIVATDVSVVAVSSAQVIRNVTLYCQTEPSKASDRRVLKTTPPAPTQYSADASGGIVFNLHQPLSGSLRIAGTVLFRLWLSAGSATRVVLNATLFEVRGQGLTKEVCTLNVGFDLEDRIREFIIAIGDVRYTFEQGSIIQLHTVAKPSNPINVDLHWGGPKTPTQVVLPCADHISIEVKTYYMNGTASSSFVAVAGSAAVHIRANVVDPFGSDDLKAFDITITDSGNLRVVDGRPMLLMSGGLTFFSTIYEYDVTLQIESYSITVNGFDMSGNRLQGSARFSIARFYSLQLQLLDAGGRPLAGADVVALQDSVAIQSQKTNNTGWAILSVPSSGTVGKYDVAIYWREMLASRLTKLDMSQDTQIRLKSSVYDFVVAVSYESLGIPVLGASVQLLRDERLVASGMTSLDGTLRLGQIPQGVYVVGISYGPFKYSISDVTLDESRLSQKFSIALIPFHYALVAIVVLVAFTVAAKRRRMPAPLPFDFLKTLTKGEIPSSCTVMIFGNPGSGKTVLSQQLMHESLRRGRPGIYITNTEFPSGIRKDMAELGMNTSRFEDNHQLVFIDCYSGAAGKPSDEDHSVSSISDLTALGIEISTSVGNLGRNVDVYLDSLTPLLTTVKPESMLNFIHSIGARVKGINGRFFFTVGTGFEASFQSKLEEAADCVIEMQLLDVGGAQKRRLRVKKMKGKEHVEKWVRFSIDPQRAIMFHVATGRSEEIAARILYLLGKLRSRF